MGLRLCWLVVLHLFISTIQASTENMHTGETQLLPHLSFNPFEIDSKFKESIENKTTDSSKDFSSEGSLGFKLSKLHSDRSCEDCLRFNHSYDSQSAELTVYFPCKNDQDPCCSPCSVGDVSLFSYYGTEDETSCLDLVHSKVFPDVDGFRALKINQSGKVAFSSTATGCYTLRLRSDFKPIPLFTGFFWVHTETNIININHWNTTFFLNPHYTKGTLEVSWQAPLGPHNFANFGLQLWHGHQKDTKINCRGEDVLGEGIEVIPKNGNIVLKKPSYIFSNLTHGWYCVRVTPLDDRCGILGCQPRSSPVMFFQDTRFTSESISAKAWPFNPLWLFVPCGLIMAAIAALCLQRRFKYVHIHKGNQYTKVDESLKTQECLIVWTPTGPDGNKLKEMVHALKRVLENNANCKVLDYLDLLSLPLEHRDQLLANPVAWVDGILSKNSVKILLIASEGASQYQKQFRLRNGLNGQSSVVRNNFEMDHSSQLDRMLFPYILRKILDQPNLSSDYSRIFHISFPSLGSSKSELEGLVTWTRYLIPQHLRTLILKIHGKSESLIDPVLLQSLDSEVPIVSAFKTSCKEDLEIGSPTKSPISMSQNISKSKLKNHKKTERQFSSTNGLLINNANSVDIELDDKVYICFKCGNVKSKPFSESHISSLDTELDSISTNNIVCICINANTRNKDIESEDENFRRKINNDFVEIRTLETNTNNSNFSTTSTEATSDDPSMDSLNIDVT